MSSITQRAALKILLGDNGPDRRFKAAPVLETLGKVWPGEVAPIAQHLMNRLECLGDITHSQLSLLQREAEDMALRALLLHRAIDDGLAGEAAIKALNLAIRLGNSIDRSLRDPLLAAPAMSESGGQPALNVSELWEAALAATPTYTDLDFSALLATDAASGKEEKNV